MKLATILLAAQIMFVAGFMSRPAVVSYLAPQEKVDRVGFDQIVANIDSGEIYNGK